MPDLSATSSTRTPESASPSYEEFLEDIKGRIRSAQARAARAINAELIEVYWQIGHEILQRQAAEGNLRGRGGPKIVERLSVDLRSAFPGVRGFSVRSLRYMRAFRCGLARARNAAVRYCSIAVGSRDAAARQALRPADP